MSQGHFLERIGGDCNSSTPQDAKLDPKELAALLRAIHAIPASAVSACPEVSEKVWLGLLGLVLSD